MDDTRRARLEHRILQELSDLLLRGEIKDHRVSTLVSFSYIKLAKDASTARIGVSSILDDRAVSTAVEGLNSAAGYLQSRVGRVIRTQATPRLHFVADNSIEEGQEIINTINRLEISEDDQRDTTGSETDGD
ncbi:MAG: 30S ribosome-binding factor RbfA [Spirochaeta sp.]|jgi:ribosome-binding factor A|nr:30S ribosome-binding factor RbfA [Spirochaeta sp.]